MKKLLYIFTLISSFLLAGCTSETENLFGESASNRVEEAMENAQKILVDKTERMVDEILSFFSAEFWRIQRADVVYCRR